MQTKSIMHIHHTEAHTLYIHNTNMSAYSYEINYTHTCINMNKSSICPTTVPQPIFLLFRTDNLHF